MNVVGIIAEYNPFHYGHKYHLNMSKKITNSKYSIAVMSGSFVQRGEPSLVDKWTKAKMAVDNGVDLVIELPFIFSTQSAELFAYGSIAMLQNLNIVDYVSFGSELGSLNTLQEIAKILVEEPPYYKHCLKKYLNIGNSFSVSRSSALVNYFAKYNNNKINSLEIKEILISPNNILSIEYLKALIKLKSNIKPVTFKRTGSGYHESSLNNKIASATAIRNTLLNKASNLDDVKDFVPHETFNHLLSYIKYYNHFNSLHNYNQIIHYLLRIRDINKLINISDVEKGLENRIVEKSTKHNDINSFIQSIITKRYPKTRIQRILIQLMMDLDKSTFLKLYSHYPSYIRVLGANKNGFNLLNKIKEKSNLPIIIKYSDYRNLDNPYIDKIISFDKRATDLFFLGLRGDQPFMNMDYYTTPYMKKK